MENSLIVEEIEHAAKKAGLTMAEVCRRAGVANSTVTRWKAGETMPNYRSVESLRAVLAQASQ